MGERSATDPGSEAATAFLIKLARALHAHGMAADRLEEALAHVSRRLGIEAQYLVTPTSIIASIGPALDARTFLLRVTPGAADLGKLSLLHDLVREVIDGELDPAAAAAAVDRLAARGGAYPDWLSIPSAAMVSGAAAVFFDGGIAEVAGAAVVGLLVGLLLQAAASAPRLRMVIPAIAAFTAVLTVSILDPLFASWTAAAATAPFIPVLAGLIVLLPGLTLTIAVSELATGHWVSGTARFVGSLVVFLQLGFGIALAGRALELLPGLEAVPWRAAAAAPQALPWWAVALALPTIAAGLMVLFAARPRHAPLILLAATAAFLGARLGSRALGPELGVLLGALLVGWLGHLASRARPLPSAVAILPGILMLVPGGLGFRSLSALLAHDVVSGIETAFATVLIAFSLVTGLLVASLTVRPRDVF